jgi:hypothetical protein
MEEEALAQVLLLGEWSLSYVLLFAISKHQHWKPFVL